MNAPGFRNDPLPTRPTISPAAYERLVDDLREYARSYLAAHGIESRPLIRQAMLDGWLAEHSVEDALVEVVGHLRDADRFAPGSDDRADCINDFAATAHRAAREHGRDGES